MKHFIGCRVMDEGILVEAVGRVVGVAVPVRGGFMFFSLDPALKVLEATVFRRAEMLTRRVAEIVQRATNLKEERATQVPPCWTVAIDAGGRVVRVRPMQWRTHRDPERPDAA